MRFVHLADIHLDTPFATRSSRVRERLREASREAFRGAVSLALEEDAHAFLVAGDLFDGSRLSFQTERFLLEELDRLAEAGVRTVYATGNHDPGRSGHRSGALAWPEGVVVVGEREPRTIDVRDGEGALVGRVTAAGHETPRESEDLSRRFPAPGSEVPEVALLHTQVEGARAGSAHDRYAPSRLDGLRRSGYDYWALGHVHVRQELSGDPPIWYPGSLLGLSPRETGAKGALLVELEPDGGAAVEFRPLAPVRWERLVLDHLADVETFHALADRVERAWDEARADDPGLSGSEWLLRLELRGPSPLHRELGLEEDRHALEEDVSARLGLLDAEVRAGDVHPPVDPDEHRERQDPLGEALRLLEELDDDGEALRELRPPEMAGAPDDPVAYLRSLLEGIDGELAARMLVGAEEDGT